MKIIYIFLILSLFLIGCEEDPDNPSEIKRGEINQPCNEDSSCKGDLICNTENICIALISCDNNPCTEVNKTQCSIENGEIKCSCNKGYTGDDCSSCIEGYTGDDCSSCIEGYHKVNETCIADKVCDNNSCIETNKTLCSIENGEIKCSCNEGYTGDDCSNCNTGYHKVNEICIVDKVCENNSCTETNKTSCSIENGVIKCSCNEGYIKDGEDCIPPNECVNTTDCEIKERCNSNGECVCQSGFEYISGSCQAVTITPFSNRTAENICQKFNEDYPDRATFPIMDSNNQTCDSGILHWDSIDDTVRRINLYRWFGMLNPVYSVPENNLGAQEAAMMMDTNNQLNHNPPDSWTCYSELGGSTAGQSNLGLGYSTPSSTIDGYIYDRGTSSLGHRRWLFNNSLGIVGIGHHNRGNCTKVFDWSGSTPGVVAFPYPSVGYYPVELLKGSWSLSIFEGNFGDISVTVTEIETNTTLDTTVTKLPNGYGPDTISIKFNGTAPISGKSYKTIVTGINGTSYPNGKYEWITHLVSCN